MNEKSLNLKGKNIDPGGSHESEIPGAKMAALLFYKLSNAAKQGFK